MNSLVASRMSRMLLFDRALLSTSSAICIGAVAGSTRRTSRARLSSRTTKSDGLSSGTGRAVLVEHARVDAALQRLRRRRNRPQKPDGQNNGRSESEAPVGHSLSIGPGFQQRQGDLRQKLV